MGDYLQVGNDSLRRPSEDLVRFLLNMLAVPAPQLGGIFGPVTTPMWYLSTNVGTLRRYFFPFFLYS